MRKISLLIALFVISTLSALAADKVVRTGFFEKPSSGWSDICIWVWNGSTHYEGNKWPGAKIVENGSPLSVAKIKSNNAEFDTEFPGITCTTETINSKTYYKFNVEVGSEDEDVNIIIITADEKTKAGGDLVFKNGMMYNTSGTTNTYAPGYTASVSNKIYKIKGEYSKWAETQLHPVDGSTTQYSAELQCADGVTSWGGLLVLDNEGGYYKNKNNKALAEGVWYSCGGNEGQNIDASALDAGYKYIFVFDNDGNKLKATKGEAINSGSGNEGGEGGETGTDYSSWWVNLPGDYNGWDNQKDGKNPSKEGLSKHSSVALGNGAFKVKLYDGNNDIWYSNDATVKSGEWVKLTKDLNKNMSVANANSDCKYDVEFNIPAGEIKLTLVEGTENNGGGGDQPNQPVIEPMGAPSGTLPVLYINVYDDADHTTYNLDMLDKNYLLKEEHKNATYYLEVPAGSTYAAEAIGSADEQLPLSIKLRGNYTRSGYAKKPYKLKLGGSQSLLGLSKSKHFALLAHADDDKGFMRNFIGFELGKLIGLPWTPSQQPVEVVINGQYRGLYFLTESIRIESGRIEIEELADNCEDASLASGGYLVELDNYNEDLSIQFRTAEKGCASNQNYDQLRVTFDTPEKYSTLQRRFIEDQFTTMNDLMQGVNNSNELWKYMDLDDAVRYYLIMELISHWEAYHGSTYMFRDRGEGQKWHFSPLWDCGNAFGYDTNPNDTNRSYYFYDNDTYGNTWIPSMRMNAEFNKKLKATWQWFLTTGYKQITAKIDTYANQIKEAAKTDYTRWNGVSGPTVTTDPVNNNEVNASYVKCNQDVASRTTWVKNNLANKIEWLKKQSDFGALPATAPAEPERDNTEAAPLPDYLTDDNGEGGGGEDNPDDNKNLTIYYDDEPTQWGDKLKIHCWEGTWTGNGWNGTSVTEHNGNIYSFTFTEKTGVPNKFLFLKDNDNNGCSAQTVDIEEQPINGHIYKITGEMSEDGKKYLIADLGVYDPETYGQGGGEDPDQPDEPIDFDDDKVYIWYDGNLSSPYVHTWSDDGNGTLTAAALSGASNNGWPGDPMIKKDGKWYWELPEAALFLPTTLIISNNGGNKAVENKEFVNGATYHDGGSYTINYTVPTAPSGTLPVLHINVYNSSDHSESNYNGDMLNKDYLLKEEHTEATCYIEVPEGVNYDWAIAAGSIDDQLPLSIKLRGNFTRSGLSKKPYKLKFAKKQNLLGLSPSKSKHYALLAHGDDDKGFMRNFIGFELGKLIGLPWTPSQQPVEVVINGQYRGLYFLTESIRIEEGRINISELADECDDPSIASGGYLVELDNYPEDPSLQFSTAEKGCAPNQIYDQLRVTFDTPEIYSPLQRRFIEEQFTKMNDLMESVNNSNELWKYMDLDDAVRYYLVMELISHWEAYHGSTYMFRDRGEGQKWHFSPLWDCGNAFAYDINPNSSDSYYFYDKDTYGNTWIPSMRMNTKFNEKLKATWQWFLSTGYKQLSDKIDAYAKQIDKATKYDYRRWTAQPKPNQVTDPVNNNQNNPSAVRTNYGVNRGYRAVTGRLADKIEWLKKQSNFGSIPASAEEPARDKTEAAPLPSYLDAWADDDVTTTTGTKVYVYDNANWSSTSDKKLYVYFYNGSKDYSSWAGEPMTFKSDLSYGNYTGLWVVNVPEGWESSGIIVNNGTSGNNNEKHQSSNDFMQMDGKNVFYITGQGTTFTKLDSQLDPEPQNDPTSGTLPVLRIKTPFKAEIPADKSKIAAKWSLTLADGTVVTPKTNDDMTIKGRGSDTWTNFDKKPYKIEFDKKQTILGQKTSKHFLLLPWAADAANGFLSNIVGHELSRRIGMEWTPTETPVEVILNGEYIGLYFFTENIRPAAERVQVVDYADRDANVGYSHENDWLIEIDNSNAEESQYSWTENGKTYHVVPSSPDFGDAAKNDSKKGYNDVEVLSSHLDNHMRAINDALDAIGSNMTGNIATDSRGQENWSRVFDADQAVKFFILQEIMDDERAFDTALFLNHTTGTKWKFGPVWDFSGAFASQGSKNHVLHGNADIPSVKPSADDADATTCQSTFANKLYNHWGFYDMVVGEFIKFTGINNSAKGSIHLLDDSAAPIGDMGAYIDSKVAEIKDAVAADAAVWPQYAATSDESSLESRATNVKDMLNKNISFLSTVWNDGNTTDIIGIGIDKGNEAEVEYFNLQGIRIAEPTTGVYIRRQGSRAEKVVVK